MTDIAPQKPQPSIQVRRATSEDAAAIRDLTRASYAKWVPVIGREPLPMTVDYDRAVREHMIDLLLVDGAVAALIETVDAGDHLLIENVAVATDLQGRGYGRQMLVHAESLAASRGLPQIKLYTNKQFAENVGLYLHLGYVIDREEPFRGGFTVYMSKRIAA